jgi:aminopeptidase YwaD
MLLLGYLKVATENPAARLFMMGVLIGCSFAVHGQVGIGSDRVCVPCIRAHLEFLASDAMRGRGSATHDELVAATYIASELRAYGIGPAGDSGGYLQRATLVRRKLTGPPRITFEGPNGGSVTWSYGKEFLVSHLAQENFSAPLRRVDIDKGEPETAPGTIILVLGSDPKKVRDAASSLGNAGAAGVMVVRKADRAYFEEAALQLPELAIHLLGETRSDLGVEFNFLEVSAEAAHILQELPQDTILHFEAPSATEESYTWNAVGMLRGSDPVLRHSAVLLSAHLDHLGIGKPVNGDDIYNGADDDASGTTAVLELARVLGAGPRPKRTVIFALFGSEEIGGLGSMFFREHPPVPLKQLIADLEFEMIGRPDPSLPDDDLWMTGWQRSNLGPTLAAHAAHVVGDPHPEQNFFSRSDNFVLAKKAIVAQTISSYGLHRDYHQPSDDLSHIDFQHMDKAIGSLLGPMRWLMNSRFVPQWNEGGKP